MTATKPKPETALMHQAHEELLHCLEQLGLTPASAARCRALPGAGKKSGIEEYFN
ncbi:MAG TPA: hypothetical protein VK598_06370 [Nitrospiraceae bacterium]|nr:hypothetical protein [Nitrospiraceae bacterium]